MFKHKGVHIRSVLKWLIMNIALMAKLSQSVYPIFVNLSYMLHHLALQLLTFSLHLHLFFFLFFVFLHPSKPPVVIYSKK